MISTKDGGGGQEDVSGVEHGVDEGTEGVVGKIVATERKGGDRSRLEEVLAFGAGKEAVAGGDPAGAVSEDDVGVGGVCQEAVLSDNDFVGIRAHEACLLQGCAIRGFDGIVQIGAVDESEAVDGSGGVRCDGVGEDVTLVVVVDTELEQAFSQQGQGVQELFQARFRLPCQCPVNARLVEAETLCLSIADADAFKERRGHKLFVGVRGIRRRVCSWW